MRYFCYLAESLNCTSNHNLLSCGLRRQNYENFVFLHQILDPTVYNRKCKKHQRSTLLVLQRANVVLMIIS